MKLNKKAVAAVTAVMMLATGLMGCGGSKAPAGNQQQADNNSAKEYRLIYASGGTSGTYYPLP